MDSVTGPIQLETVGSTVALAPMILIVFSQEFWPEGMNNGDRG